MHAHHYEHFYLDPKFWVAVSFVLFVLLVGKMGWTKITEMLDARTARIKGELEEASRLRHEAEAMMAAARKEREQAIQEAAALLARAQGRGRARGCCGEGRGGGRRPSPRAHGDGPHRRRRGERCDGDPPRGR